MIATLSRQKWFNLPNSNKSSDCSSILNLYPFDLDGDVIECRWAYPEEARGGAHDATKWPFISLDKNCILSFDSKKWLEVSDGGIKQFAIPISVMVEDMVPSQNDDITADNDHMFIRSSIPVQFMATTKTKIESSGLVT